jgi:hypothetical protein
MLPDAEECVLLNLSEYLICDYTLFFYMTPKMKAQRHEIIRIMWGHAVGPPVSIN